MNDVCVFCLSADRNLDLIKQDHWNIINLLSEVKKSDIHLENRLRICWECEGKINKFCHFKKCAQKCYVMFVQYFVLGERENPLIPKSKLFTTAMETIDLPAIYSDDIEEDGKYLFCSNIDFVNLEKLQNQDIDAKNIKTEQMKTIENTLKSDSNNDLDASIDCADVSDNDMCTPGAQEHSPLSTVAVSPKRVKHDTKTKVNQKHKLKRQGRCVPRDSQVSWVLESQALQWYKEERAAERDANPTFHHQCDACERLFISRQQLDIHIDEHHSEAAGSFQCNLCQYRFADALCLKKHQDKHYVKYLCNKCDYETRLYGDMESHVKEKHDQMFRCGRCKEEISSNKRRIHMKHCTLYKCSNCEETYKDRSVYIDHIKTHRRQTEGTTYCEGCQSYIRNSWYEKHFSVSLRHVSRDMLKFTCEHCGEKRPTASLLRMHIFTVHLKTGVYQCSMCPNKYMMQRQLNRHLAIRHKTGPVVRTRDKICELCGKGFLSNNMLNQHRRIHTGERPYKCEFCPAAYVSHGSLYTHNVTAHQRRIGKGAAAVAERITCNQCDKTYPTNTKLKQHIKSAHLNVRFECDLCDKSFTSKYILMKHKVRQHNHVATFNHVCKCGKSFETDKGMKNHKHFCPSLNTSISKKPSNKQYKCRECGETFKLCSYVYVHYKIKHLQLRAKDKVSIRNLFDLTKEVVVTRNPAIKTD